MIPGNFRIQQSLSNGDTLSRNSLSESYGALMYHRDRLRTYKGDLQSSQADANVDTEVIGKIQQETHFQKTSWRNRKIPSFKFLR